uniref:Zinc finger, AN1-type domain 1 n=1 Tax=Paramormyrops kingsleyae TaxID=1676925 RepID=A0A3B3TAT7_9TELE|nr:AN1-type zinc finger protein 1 isoform X2 [Paramormyrops kingsleyae]
MAEVDIGEHCQVETCSQKDFLPFVCDACSGVFCVEHRSRGSHSCTEIPAVKEAPPSGGSISYHCDFANCSGKELVPVVCAHCQKHFCLAHRHQDDHKCVRLETSGPRMAATQELVKKIVESKAASSTSKGRKGAKNSATAAKVALMKLKLHAVGDKGLPQTERTYFQVFLPKGSRETSSPMFFCSKWTVGRVVDFAALQAGLKNNNNVVAAKKLRLCHPQTGRVLKMDDTLLSLLSHPDVPLFNGGNIILEYLDNDSTELPDFDTYLPRP